MTYSFFNAILTCFLSIVNNKLGSFVIQTVMKPAASFEHRLNEKIASKTKGKKFLLSSQRMSLTKER